MIMAEISVTIADDLKVELEEFGLNVPKIVEEAITFKLAEQHLAKSKALQRALFETIVSKSKLTPEGAKELALLIDQGMLHDMKEKIPVS